MWYTAENVMQVPQISIQSFTGAQIAPYLSCIARLRAEMLREYPYLCNHTVEEESRYLERYLKTPTSIAVIVFDGSMVVGAAMGLPFEKETEEMVHLFQEQQQNVEDYFYFGKCVLLPEYRRRGIAHHFFDLREAHAQECGKFRAICFWEICRPENHPKKPTDFLSLDHFWRKRGYSMRPELTVSLSWKELDEEVETAKQAVYWTKEHG